MDSMAKQQLKVTITLSKEMYEELQHRAEYEARTLAGLAKYLLIKGLESERLEQNTVK